MKGFGVDGILKNIGKMSRFVSTFVSNELRVTGIVYFSLQHEFQKQTSGADQTLITGDLCLYVRFGYLMLYVCMSCSSLY